MPEKRDRRGKPAPMPLHHDDVQARLLAYSYGRLPRAEDAAVEAHVAQCARCRAEGLHHLAAERMHAMQQRAKSPRATSTRAIVVTLSVILAALVGISGFLIIAAAHSGALRSFGRPSATATVAPPTATPTRSPTAVPTALSPLLTLPAPNVDTLAWSPDGTILATAADPNPSKGTVGGVVLYTNIGPNQPLLSKRLYGFENIASPGTLAWSPDGTQLAATARSHLIIWNSATGQVVMNMSLPVTPGSNLYVFDTINATLVMSAPSSIFAATGLVQWGQNGLIRQAPAGAAGPTGLPGSTSPVMALWGGQQGTRIFRDTHNTTMLGTSDQDVQFLAAYLRWSPDKRYLLWGYPRVPVAANLLNRQPTHATTIGVPDAAFAAAVQTVKQSADPTTSVEIWPSVDGTRLLVFDGTSQPVTFALENPSDGGVSKTISTGGKTGMLLNQASFGHAQPLTLAVATRFDVVTVYGAG